MRSLRNFSRNSFSSRLLSLRSWTHGRRRRPVNQGAGLRPVEGLESRLLLSASPATEVLVNTTTAGTQRTHTEGGRSLDTDAEGGYVAVWASTVGDGSGWGVFGQRYDPSGEPAGGEFAVNTTTANDQNNAAVAVRPDGSFIVTWQSRLQDGADFGIYARTFAADGTPTSGEIAVNTTTIGNQQLPVIANLAGGGFAIAWNGRGPGDANGIFARVFDSTGSPVTGEIAVNTTKDFAQTYASIAADSDGGFAVVWHGNGGSDRKNVMFRHFDGEGTALSEEVVVNETQAGIQKTPSIAQTTDGNFVVVWSGNGHDHDIGVVGVVSEGDGHGSNDDHGIFARRIDGAGNPLGGDMLVNFNTADVQTTPSVIGTDDNGFAVTWADQSSPAPNANFEIAFREFTGSDHPLGVDALVNTTLTGRQWSPTIALADDHLIVSWSGRGIGDSFGVFTSWVTHDLPSEVATASLVESSGLRQSAADEIPVSLLGIFQDSDSPSGG